MNKSKIAFVFFLVGISSAEAASTKTFHTMDGVEKGCKLAKFSGGKWVQSNENDLNGQDVASVTPSKANGDFSNFKYQNTWYAAKNECLKDSDSATADASGDSVSTVLPQYAVEVKIQKTLLMGSGNSATSSGTVNGITSSTDAYASGVGFDGRFLYHWKDNKYFFFDISDLPASQNTNYTSGVTGTSQASDTLLMINIGMEYQFTKPLFGLKPYVAAFLGYSKLTGTIQGPITTSTGSGNLAIAYSGGGYDLGVEGGLVKEFSSHWDALVTLGLDYVHVNPSVTQSNFIYGVGTASPPHGYSHFTLALGARYNF